MQNMEHFLADRALTLLYEARQFPQTAPVARAWLFRAELWARQQGLLDLVDSLYRQIEEMEV